MKEEGQGGRGSSPARQNSVPETTLPGWRTDRGPRLLGAVMPQVTRPAFKKRSPAAAQLIAEWPSVVGPVLAAQTIPRGLTGGTLTIACSGPVAMELQHLAPQLIGKVNSAMGHALVQRLRFVQGVVPPPARRPPPPKPVAIPETVSTALESVEDPQLREALARLAQGVYRGRRSPG